MAHGCCALTCVLWLRRGGLSRCAACREEGSDAFRLLVPMDAATGVLTRVLCSVARPIKGSAAEMAAEKALAVHGAGVRAQPQMLIRVSLDPDSEVVTFSSTEASLGEAHLQAE